MRDVSKPVVAREFMQRNVRSIDADTDILDALKELRKWGFSGAPVKRDGKVVGVLSEMDCMRVLSNAAYHGMPTGAVSEHMTRDVAVVAPDTDVFAVAQRLAEECHRRLPVVDGDELVGLVTVHDVDAALWEIAQGTVYKGSADHPPGAAWDEEASRRRDDSR